MTAQFEVPKWLPEPTIGKPGRGHRPLPPGQDPFYRSPVGVEALAPGTIIRSREVEVAFLGAIPLKCSAWQVLYRSSDLNRAAEVTVTTVLLPSDGGLIHDRPLLAYQCAIDAVAAEFRPSHVLQRGRRSAGTVPQYELLVIANALRKGWAVSIADHQGAEGRFGAPREPGYRVLDGIRAALDFAPLGLAQQSPVAVWGYSGGGMASSWAAEMAPEYAPEINLVGAVLGAPVGDPAQAFVRLNGTWLAGFPVMVIAAIRHAYPDFDRALRSHINAAGLDRLSMIEELDTLPAVRRFAGDDLDTYLDEPLADVLGLPEVLKVFDDLRLGGHIPSCPLLVVQGVHDQIISVEDIDGQVRRYLDGGARVTYLRDRCSEHLTLMPLCAPLSLDWLDDRIAARPLPRSSTRTVWSTALSTKAIRGLLRMALVAALVILGRDVTPSRRGVSRPRSLAGWSDRGTSSRPTW